MRGYYGHTGAMAKMLADYADENSMALTGPVYNIYLLDEISVIDPNRYLLQVSIPIGRSSARRPSQADRRKEP